MVSAIAPDPVHAGNTNLADTRHRPVVSERSVLADSAPPAPKNPGAGDNGQFPGERHNQPDQRKDNSSMFAAAVIAGALPPTPQTMEELILRIGTSAIPEESEARLKDILV